MADRDKKTYDEISRTHERFLREEKKRTRCFVCGRYRCLTMSEENPNLDTQILAASLICVAVVILAVIFIPPLVG